MPWRTALVTGASSGIGEAFAHELAARGVERLVVVARDRKRLTELAGLLHDRHGTEVEVLAADLTSSESRQLVEERLLDRGAPRIELLVNNAGIGTRGPLADLPVDDEVHEIELNVVAVMRLTRLALPAMLERGSGNVINVSSLASEQPTPFHATYAGTKAFVTHFTESLAEELHGTGVNVTAVLPGFIRTEFAERAGMEAETDNVPAFVWMQPSAVASASLDAAAAGKVVCVPGTGYLVMTTLTSMLPRSWRRRMVGAVSRSRRS